MGYTINYNTFTSIFAVPAQVADRYLFECSEISLKVLLLLLRRPEEPINPETLAAALRVSAPEIQNALLYWTQQGLLNSGQPVQNQFSPNEPVYQEQAHKPENLSETQKRSQKISISAEKKNMTISEIDQLSRSDPRIAELADAVQGVLGRPVSRTELESILSFYTYAGLPPEYILLVCAHCVSIGRTNTRSIVKTMNEMIAEGIETYEQAEAYIDHWSRRSTNENQIKSAFGIYDRKLTSQQKKFIDTWFNSFHFDISIIKLAYEKTIDSIGKVSFPYMNSILASWHSKGITTTKEAAEESASNSFSGKKQADPLQSSIDMDELQRYITYGKDK